MRFVALACVASLVTQLPTNVLDPQAHPQAHPQLHPLVGEWTVFVPTGIQMQGGQRSEGLARGRLSVTSAADSLVATLALESPEGYDPRPAVHMAARRVDGAVTMRSRTETSLVVNREVSRAIAVTTFVFDVRGDSLAGSVTRAIEGGPSMDALAISGTRRQP
jgi:hypothetical protein